MRILTITVEDRPVAGDANTMVYSTTKRISLDSFPSYNDHLADIILESVNRCNDECDERIAEKSQKLQ